MKRLLTAAALGAAALATRRYLSVRDDLARVPAEFRSPLLPLLATDTTGRSLWFGVRHRRESHAGRLVYCGG